MSERTSGRDEDAVLAALDDEAAYLSHIYQSVSVIAAHRPNREIRMELRRILAALGAAREQRVAARAAYTERKRRG